MKAIVYHKYGPPDVKQLKEVEKSASTEEEVLVKVHAASVNYSDWDFVRGKPFLIRIYQGLLKPKNRILGADIAGRVEAVGRNVKHFQSGDEVFADLSGRVEAVGQNVKHFQSGDEVFADLSGCGWGDFAEYVAVPENVLALKPASMKFEETAAVPQAAVVALQGLRDNGQIQPGQRV
jgi:NADPH:quinone reductase-like Zn-dependent oxidoreductase